MFTCAHNNLINHLQVANQAFLVLCRYAASPAAFVGCKNFIACKADHQVITKRLGLCEELYMSTMEDIICNFVTMDKPTSQSMATVLSSAAACHCI
jgi:hypothetical protein